MGEGEQMRELAEAQALRNIAKAARELDEFFDPKDKGGKTIPGDLDEWDLDGRRATGRVSLALLSLHDRLNDLGAVQADMPAAVKRLAGDES